MRLWISLLLVLPLGCAVGFFGTLWFLPDPSPPPLRKHMILAWEDLRSSLLGQPLPKKRGILIEAPEGHPEGHIVSTLGKELDDGDYRFEISMDTRASRTNNGHVCIMDLLAGGKLISNSPVQIYRGIVIEQPSIDFRSPATNGSRIFKMRLYCNGAGEVRVKKVVLIRNPNSPQPLPSVIIQD